MALLEKEAIRFAESLDDYEHVTVTDISDWGPINRRVAVRDHRFDTDYEIASHCDYWEVVSSLVRSVPAANSRRGTTSTIEEVPLMHKRSL